MNICVQAKLDGVSLRATYQDGKLVQLVTRGDGEIGDDITVHAPHLCNLPQFVPSFRGVMHVRGEGIIYEEDFRQIFKPKGQMNARNMVTGLLKGRSTPEDLKFVHFVALEMHGQLAPATESDSIRTLRSTGFEVPSLVFLVTNAVQAEKVYTDYDAGGRQNLPYKTDGLVLKIDDKKLQSNYPMSGGRPGHAVAVKPSPKACLTRVKKLVWEMGLSGAYTPVAEVEPAELDGTTLRRVNMFNLDFLDAWVNGGEISVPKSEQHPTGKRKLLGGFGVGAEILVVRSGDVIPYLTDVVVPVPRE